MEMSIIQLSRDDLHELFKQAAREAFLLEKPDLIQQIRNSFEGTPDEDVILNAVESAQYLGISLPTFYEYTSRNLIPFYKQRKKIQCKKAELKAWIESGRRKTHGQIQEEAASYIKKRRK